MTRSSWNAIFSRYTYNITTDSTDCIRCSNINYIVNEPMFILTFNYIEYVGENKNCYATLQQLEYITWIIINWNWSVEWDTITNQVYVLCVYSTILWQALVFSSEEKILFFWAHFIRFECECEFSASAMEWRVTFNRINKWTRWITSKCCNVNAMLVIL